MSSTNTTTLTSTALEVLNANNAGGGISDMEFALTFLPKAGVDPKIVGTSSNDRLIKTARMIMALFDKPKSTTADASTTDTDHHQNHLVPDLTEKDVETSIQRLVKDFALLPTLGHVPRVPFGKTGIDMPIVTIGCMRFQMAWGDRVKTLDQVDADCQDNLVATLRTAIVKYGMVHIETARAYGCSELQLGAALRQLFLSGDVQRKDLIIQTKVNPSPDPAVFRQELETSMRLLGVKYIDLFSVHGFNLPEHWDWCFGQDGNNCIKVVREFQAAGKILHVGFSTHGPTDLILKAINSNEFEYCNVHYHAFGSYTASGYGQTRTGGNLEVLERLQAKEMGCFIISPFDKGGALYAPSNKLRHLVAPDTEPIIFHAWWLWNHAKLLAKDGVLAPPIHTFTVGVARVSDLEEPVLAAHYYANEPEMTLKVAKSVWERLLVAREQALGKEWTNSWFKGLPKALTSQYQIEHNQMVWLYNCVQAFGMYEFAKTRYKSFEGNAKTWDYSRSAEENHAKRGTRGWGYVPGLPLDPDHDYSVDLKEVPKENLPRVIDAEAFVRDWLATPKNTDTTEGGEPDSKVAKLSIPFAWETAYDLRTWSDYPDRPENKKALKRTNAFVGWQFFFIVCLLGLSCATSFQPVHRIGFTRPVFGAMYKGTTFFAVLPANVKEDILTGAEVAEGNIWEQAASVFVKIEDIDLNRDPDKVRRYYELISVLRIGLPAILWATGSHLAYPTISMSLANSINDSGVFAVVSQDSSQYIQNILTTSGLVFSLLAGQTFYFMYQQQEAIYLALFEEVTMAKSLLEQVSLVCQGRQNLYQDILACIDQYVQDDLARFNDKEPAMLISSRPVDDPLENILYLTSVGEPSIVYQTVRSLRQARAYRLGALQRKLPPIHSALLYTLAAIVLFTFPLLGAGSQTIGGPAILNVQAWYISFIVFGISLVMGVIEELQRPGDKGAYNARTVLAVMLCGLQEDLALRLSGEGIEQFGPSIDADGFEGFRGPNNE